jgi:hypothetical protein
MRFTRPVRTTLLVAVFLLAPELAACSSSSSASDTADAAGPVGEDDGSTAGCTSLGGTCTPASAPGCAPLEQNPSLCGNVILVCCLPPGSLGGVLGSDAAGAADTGLYVVPGLDASTGGAPPDAATPDAGRASDATVD